MLVSEYLYNFNPTLLTRPENSVFGSLNMYLMELDALLMQIQASNAIPAHQILSNARVVLHRTIDNSDVQMFVMDY